MGLCSTAAQAPTSAKRGAHALTFNLSAQLALLISPTPFQLSQALLSDPVGFSHTSGALWELLKWQLFSSMPGCSNLREMGGAMQQTTRRA